MSRDIVKYYKNLTDLKKKIIAEYVIFLIQRKCINNLLLENKEWASDGGEYHNKCREDIISENKKCTAQIKILNKIT